MNHLIDNTIDVFRHCEGIAESQSDRDLLRRQIRALEAIKDSLSQYGTMRHQITSFEKLLCNPWIEDQQIFDTAYAAWESFRKAYEREIGAMSVNERLCHMGLMEELEEAHGKPAAMRTVLRAVFLSPDNIEAVIRHQGAQAGSRGFFSPSPHTAPHAGPHGAVHRVHRAVAG